MSFCLIQVTLKRFLWCFLLNFLLFLGSLPSCLAFLEQWLDCLEIDHTGIGSQEHDHIDQNVHEDQANDEIAEVQGG